VTLTKLVATLQKQMDNQNMLSFLAVQEFGEAVSTAKQNRSQSVIKYYKNEHQHNQLISAEAIKEGL